jgi:hypothetical protein
MSHPPEHATKPNLLTQIAALPDLTLDVDSMDPAMATKFPGISFCDMTSNQTLVYIEAVRDENRPLVEQSIRYALRNGSKQLDETNIQDALDLLVTVGKHRGTTLWLTPRTGCPVCQTSLPLPYWICAFPSLSLLGF